ncbi:MAG: uridine diphosphate-N-acetylglucosamine-binding protein YvcK [Fimbriimonadaceae bacterium]
MTRRRPLQGKIERLVAPVRGLRRYFFLGVAGVLLFLIGLVLSFQLFLKPMADRVAGEWNRLLSQFMPSASIEDTNHLLGGLLLFLGILLGVKAWSDARNRLLRNTDPTLISGAFDSYRHKQLLANGPKIVAIGGGTGLSTLLRGLKQYTRNITAVVTVTDDGGSSGRLSREMGILPPGDIRNCLVALADAERLMTDLFQHRFSAASGSLSGHSVGNLLLAGFLERAGGDFDEAIEMVGEVLSIRGRVVPSTKEKVHLKALMEDGREICGETAIVDSGQRVRRVYIDPASPAAHPDAIQAIKEADVVCIGPGSVFTSIIPNLLVGGLAEALEECEAPRVYVCNVMTQVGESESFTAAEHLVAVQANVHGRVCDYVIVNTATPSTEILDRYKGSGQDIVVPDVDRLRSMGYRVITGDFMNETDYVRHDAMRVAAKIVELVHT